MNAHLLLGVVCNIPNIIEKTSLAVVPAGRLWMQQLPLIKRLSP
jgi:hypothetical protein